MTDHLTDADKKHWHPPSNLTAWLAERIPQGARVLDVGAGYLPFPRADVLVDWVAPSGAKPGQEVVICDFGREGLPFPDKSFDFVYCRQTIEDMHDPFSALREIARVGKAGYVETPSPLAELCRGIDGGSPPWRGYNHHRWITWVHQGELRFVSKYPLIEYLPDFGVAEKLKTGPKYWGTYYLWSDTINAVHRQNPLDFTMPDNLLPLLREAVERSVAASDEFWRDIPATTTIPLIGLGSAAA